MTSYKFLRLKFFQSFLFTKVLCKTGNTSLLTSLHTKTNRLCSTSCQQKDLIFTLIFSLSELPRYRKGYVNPFQFEEFSREGYRPYFNLLFILKSRVFNDIILHKKGAYFLPNKRWVSADLQFSAQRAREGVNRSGAWGLIPFISGLNI